MELVLASTSPYRRQLLERLGVPFKVASPQCDEEAFKSLGLGPEALAVLLAKEKMQSVATIYPNEVVIGSDQLAELDGKILGKPGTPAKAVEQLLFLSGKTHRLITAMAMKYKTRIFEHTEIAELSVRPMTRAQAERYVQEENPVDCAGSYRFEAGGIRLLHMVQTDDATAIIGLPLLRLGDWLTLVGFPFP